MHNKQRLSEKPTLPTAVMVIIGLLALIMVGLVHTTPPAPLSAIISPSVFSSARAMLRIRQIAQKAHPIGSAEHTKVRQHLVTELKALGFKPQIQIALGIHQSEREARVGVVHNVLVRIPGRISGKALLLAAHYDSTHTGPGAADNGASVAAILETLRALKHLPDLQNDLICIFTDGEEAGLLGAEAFVAEHPWAKQIGMVLNFEYRGNRGSHMMFETSPGNSQLIDGFAKAVPRPFANSLMYEVYKHLPNDTDLTVFKRAGIAGMNFSAIEGHTSYHTQLDRPERLQQGSLQHQGDTLLALTQYFGNASLDDLQSDDSIYFDAPGVGLIHYSVSWALPLCAVLAVLSGIVLMLGVRSGEIRVSRMALGAVAFLVIVSATGIISQFLWLGIRRLHPEYDTLLQGDTYNSHWYLLAFVMLVIGFFALLQSGMQRWICPQELAFGAVALWLICLIAASVWMPGASFLFFWSLAPLLIMFGFLFWLHINNSASPLYCELMLLGAAPSIVLLTPFIKNLFIGLTPQLLGVVMMVLAMLLGLLVPLINMLTQRWLLPRLPIVIGIVCLVTGSCTAKFDSEHPRPNQLFYAMEASTGNAFWLSQDTHLDAWTRTFFPSRPAQRFMPELFGEEAGRAFWVATAPPVAVSAPTVKVLEDSTHNHIRNINIQVRSQRQAPRLSLSLAGTSIISAKVEGRPLSRQFHGQWRLQGFGMPKEGLNIELTVQAGVPFAIRVADMSYELPANIFKPRPDHMIAQPFGLTDTTMVINTVSMESYGKVGSNQN